MAIERIYIAGPYQPKGCTLHDAARQAQRNVDLAIAAANQLIREGHFVFVPHLSHFIHCHASCQNDYCDWWYKEDNTFLDYWATAIYMLKDWEKSDGAKKELNRAKNLGLKIMFEEKG
jgi:hypothetical protein